MSPKLYRFVLYTIPGKSKSSLFNYLVGSWLVVGCYIAFGIKASQASPAPIRDGFEDENKAQGCQSYIELEKSLEIQAILI